jgi:multisubunit Na+/H+ antiporter MnhE subunit
VKRLKVAGELFLCLLIFWLLFTMSLSIQNILIGICVSFLITHISLRVFYADFETVIRIPNIFTLSKYLVRLIYEIYIASFVNILRIIKADYDIKLVKVQLDITTPLLVTIIANSITLTPGTITVEAKGNILYVLTMKDDGLGGAKIQKDIKDKFEKYFL